MAPRESTVGPTCGPRRLPRGGAALKRALLAVFVLGLTSGCGEVEGTAERSVLLFTVDTLRADQLGAYGGPASTPHFDALAAQSLVFERAYSQATITHPALSSLHTGLLPHQHGVQTQTGLLREGSTTLAQRMRDSGRRTAAFTANLCKLQGHPGTVFHDGFDDLGCGMLDDPEDYRDQWEWDKRVVDLGLEWLASNPGPFFVWLHLMDPHAEHRPPPHLIDPAWPPLRDRMEQYAFYNGIEERRERPDPQEYEHLWALYRAEIEGADEQLGRVLNQIERRRDADDIAVIFSSDHGEELFETWSRYDHGLSLTEGVLRVPLTVRAPGVAPGRFEAPVELLQITPTALHIVGAAVPANVAGPSLLSERPSRGYALSSAARLTITLRSAEHRYWQRLSPTPPKRPPEAAPWRLDAPWYQQREALASYGADGVQPTWLPLHDPDNRATGSHHELRWNQIEAAFPPRGITREILADAELSNQLQRLGYVGD